MAPPRSLLVLPLLLLWLPLAPSAAADASVPEVWVPETVVGDGVPFVVTGMSGETSATLAVDGASVVLDATGLDAVDGVLSGVATGLHAWTVTVTDDATPHEASGYVYVQSLPDAASGLDDRLAALEDALERVDRDVDDIEDAVERIEVRLGASNHTALDENVTALLGAVGALRVRVDLLEASLADDEAADEEALAAASLSGAVDPVGRAGTWTVLGVVLVLGGVAAWTQVRAVRRQREAMVLLLSLAAKLQVTPDSEEFRTAVEALE